MTTPAPGLKEVILRKSSWGAFAFGILLILLAAFYGYGARESRERMDNRLEEVQAGLITVSPQERAILEYRKHNYVAPDFSGTRDVGILLLLVGLGFSIYANVLRKKRVGQ
jgi:hypothetical protein